MMEPSPSTSLSDDTNRFLHYLQKDVYYASHLSFLSPFSSPPSSSPRLIFHATLSKISTYYPTGSDLIDLSLYLPLKSHRQLLNKSHLDLRKVLLSTIVQTWFSTRALRFQPEFSARTPIPPIPAHEAHHRLSLLIQASIWKNSQHSILKGIVNITGIPACDIHAIARGRISDVPKILQADLNAYVQGYANIYACIHAHRLFAEGPSDTSLPTASGLSMRTAQSLHELALMNWRNGVQTLVWIDVVHERVRQIPWSVGCLLPFALFEVIQLDINEDGVDNSCIRHHQRQVSRISSSVRKRSNVDEMLFAPFHCKQVLLQFAVELMLDPSRCKDGCSVKLEDILQLPVVNFRNLSCQLPIAPNQLTVVRKLEHEVDQLLLLDNVLSVKGLSEQFCRKYFVAEEGYPSWCGLQTILLPNVFQLLGREHMIRRDVIRVENTVWVVQPEEKRALVLETAEGEVCKYVIWVEFKDVYGGNRLTGRVSRGGHVNIGRSTAIFLKFLLKKVEVEKGQEVGTVNLRRILKEFLDKFIEKGLILNKKVGEFVMGTGEGEGLHADYQTYHRVYKEFQVNMR